MPDDSRCTARRLVHLHPRQVTAAATEELAPAVDLLVSGGQGRGVTYNINTYIHLISKGAHRRSHPGASRLTTLHPCTNTAGSCEL